MRLWPFLLDIDVRGAANPAEQHPALELAAQEIGSGDYARARQRIYALLSIVDRLAPEERTAIESRASFLLARAYHMEALARTQAAPPRPAPSAAAAKTAERGRPPAEPRQADHAGGGH